MAKLIETPHEHFTNSSGDMLDAGYLYVGVVNLDPVSNPTTVYWDKNLTIIAAQPIRTISGKPSYNGTPGNLYTGLSDYSLTVLDKNQRLVATVLSAKDTGTVSSGVISAETNTPDNRVISGRTRVNSQQPSFLDLDGGTASVTVLGSATPLVVAINGASVTVETDIVVSGLTVAPASNNTCLINDGGLSDQPSSKYAGEYDTVFADTFPDDPGITIDNAGSEITSRIGQTCAFQKNGGSEILLAYIKSATQLVNVRRGWFYDEDDDPIVRETLANNDQLNILSLVWLFMQNDEITVDATNRTPTYSFTAPTTPLVGDYWFDMSINKWKRYTTTWAVINRTLIGMVAVGTAYSVGKRELDFFHDYRDTNTVALERLDDDVVQSVTSDNTIFVYSKTLRIQPGKLKWNGTTDMETGVIAADTKYYLYLAATGEFIISTEKYYNRPDLLGLYHPYEAWRCIGIGITDSSADWETVYDFVTFNIDPYINRGSQLFTSSGTFFVPIGVNKISVAVLGGGGGGAAGTGSFNGPAAGGGGLAWGSLDVTPGDSFTVTVGAGGGLDAHGVASSFSNGGTVNIIGGGGLRGSSGGAGGVPSGGDGGGTGGEGGTNVTGLTQYNGGGGAAGYTGDGGAGREGLSTPATNGSGGGGSGSDGNIGTKRGGGVGMIIKGDNGVVVTGEGGNPGSTDFTTSYYGAGGDGGQSGNGTSGVQGAVRVVWGYNKNGQIKYPDNSAV